MALWQWIVAGRSMMIPIGLASLLGLAVIIERLIILRRGRIIVPEIAAAVDTLDSGRDLSVAYALCQSRPGPFANIVLAGLDHADNDWTVIRDVLQESGRREATLLTRRLGVLETVAAVSPLLGLLGTVLGMGALKSPTRMQAPNTEPCRDTEPRYTESRAAPRPRHTESPHPPVSGRRRPDDGVRYRHPAPRNAPENTIARFPASAYHGYMTSRQAPKRPGYMNPAPRLSAALACGVIAW